MLAKKWYIFLFAIILACTLIWFWYVQFFEPLCAQEKLKRVHIGELEQKKVLIPDLRYRVDLLQKHNDTIRSELQKQLLHHESVDPYVTLEHVLLNMDEIGLRLVALTPQEFVRKAFYEKCTFGFKALGTYEQIMLLFDHFCEKHTH